MKDMTNLVKPALAELVGTFFLTLAGLISGTPYIVGVTLGIFVYTIGSISGCNINPAVTLGLLVRRKLPIVKGIVYIVAQLAGAGLALLAALGTGRLAPHYAAASPLEEFLGFGILMLTVLAATDKKVPQEASGLAIGAALTAGLVVSRGILNPAVAVAMGQALSPATWATLLSAVVFCLLYMLYQQKDASTAQATPAEQDSVSPQRLPSVPRAR